MPVRYTLASVLTLRSGTIPVITSVVKTGASVGAAITGYHAHDAEAFASIQHAKLARLATVGTNGTAQTPEKLTTRAPASTATATQSYPTVGDEPAVSGNELIILVLPKQATNPLTTQRFWNAPNPRYPVMMDVSQQVGITWSDSGAPTVGTIIFDDSERNGAAAERGRRSRRRGLQQYADGMSYFSGDSTRPKNIRTLNQHMHVIAADWPDEAYGSERFLNLLNSSGSVFNEAVTLPVTLALSNTAQLNAVGNITLGVTLGYSVTGLLNINSAITLGVTTGMTLIGGLDLQGAITLAVTMGFSVSATLSRQGAITLPVTMGFSVLSVLSALNSITLGVTMGLSFTAQLDRQGAITLGVTLGYSTAGGTLYLASVTMNVNLAMSTSASLSRQGAISLAVIMGYSLTTTAVFNSALTLPVTAGLAVSASRVTNPSISLGVTLGFTLQSFLGVIIELVLAWDEIRSLQLSDYAARSSQLSSLKMQGAGVSEYTATRTTTLSTKDDVKELAISEYKAKGDPQA